MKYPANSRQSASIQRMARIYPFPASIAASNHFFLFADFPIISVHLRYIIGKINYAAKRTNR
jgi:hypothetical protein